METVTAMDTTHGHSRVTLDPEQRRAVEHAGGPLLACGGPGTGKSLVLVERWVRLATAVVAPHRVLMLVASRERALELRDELPWKVPGRALIEVPVHTWHAFAYHLVSRYYRVLGYREAPVLLTAPEQWAAVRDLLRDESRAEWGAYGDQLSARAFVDEVADFCTRVGQRAVADAGLEAIAADRPDHAAVARFAIRYREHLATTSRLDYAGVVEAASRLLGSSADVAARVRDRFPHVLVDDAQELASAQLGLMERLETTNLVCAADPDSAIESFRGADPSWLTRFGKVVPGHQTIVLATSHRLGPRAGEVAARLIGHSSGPGAHRPTRFAGPADATADVRCHATMAGEVTAAARRVRAAHLREAIPYERMAIVVAQPSTYIPALGRMLTLLGVPHRIRQVDRPLAADPAVRAVLDLCRIALADDPPDDLVASVLGSPIVGLEPQEVRELRREAFKRDARLFRVGVEACDEFARLCELVRSGAGAPADATFATLFEESAWCRTMAEHREAYAAQLAALVELSRALGHFVERRRGGTMRAYLDSSAEAGFASARAREADEGGVLVTSFHAAKGAEWDLVCVLGVAEGLLPKAHRARGLFDPWALAPGSGLDRALARIDEERRTMYVAVTRARRHLVVSCSPGPAGRAGPSRFIEEAFGAVPETVAAAADDGPLTHAEAASFFRRTIARPDATTAERAAAACALARIPGVDPSAWWWRRDWTPSTRLAPEGKLTTSYSRIGRYDECPLRYVLEAVLGLDPESTYQMKFGALIHRIIERVERGELVTEKDVDAAYKEGFARHKADYPNFVFARTYYRAGARMLNRWWELERHLGETVEVEFAFDDLDLDGHTIRGRIDRVAKLAEGLVLSDYKTAVSMADVEEVRRSLQLAIYYRAAKTYPQLRDHGEPHSMVLVYPAVKRTDPEGHDCLGKRVQRPEEAEEALVRLREILERAAREEFAPSPEADCRWCKMKPLCPRWPEGREAGP